MDAEGCSVRSIDAALHRCQREPVSRLPSSVERFRPAPLYRDGGRERYRPQWFVLEAHEVDPIYRKKALHHRSLASQAVYTAPAIADITRTLDAATVHLEGSVLKVGLRSPYWT